MLTFDDGPSESTGEILAILAEHGLTAMFFMVGRRIHEYRDAVAWAAAAGHAIGNHTWDHVSLLSCSDARIVDQLERTNQAIEDVLGHPPTLFRAPWLSVNKHVECVAFQLGLTHVGVDVTPGDWLPDRPVERIARGIRRASPDDLVLLHDGNGRIKAGPHPRPKTVAALRLALG